MGSVIDYSNGSIGCFVLNSDERVDWIIVSRSWLENCIVPGWPIVKRSLLLFKTHRISVKYLVVLVLCQQVESHLLADIVSDRNAINEGFNKETIVSHIISSLREVKFGIETVSFEDNGCSSGTICVIDLLNGRIFLRSV